MGDCRKEENAWNGFSTDIKIIMYSRNVIKLLKNYNNIVTEFFFPSEASFACVNITIFKFKNIVFHSYQIYFAGFLMTCRIFYSYDLHWNKFYNILSSSFMALWWNYTDTAAKKNDYLNKSVYILILNVLFNCLWC